jgi:hypothetical protein
MGTVAGKVFEEGGEVLRGDLGNHLVLGAGAYSLECANLVVYWDREFRWERGVFEGCVAD